MWWADQSPSATVFPFWVATSFPASSPAWKVALNVTSAPSSTAVKVTADPSTVTVPIADFMVRSGVVTSTVPPHPLSAFANVIAIGPWPCAMKYSPVQEPARSSGAAAAAGGAGAAAVVWAAPGAATARRSAAAPSAPRTDDDRGLDMMDSAWARGNKGTRPVRPGRARGFIPKQVPGYALGGAILVAALIRPGAVEGQAAYTPATLSCARYSEEARSELETEMGRRTRRSAAGRDGVLVIRGRPDSVGVRIEAWYDSLTIWREGPEGRLEPDPDGFIGGRFTGRLDARGRYLPVLRPFLPAEIGEIVRLDRVLDDFFPRLPPAGLEPGQRWSDSAGAEVRRLADSVATGVALGRFAYERPAMLAPAEPAAPDTLTPGLTEEGRETGRFVWHPQEGLVRLEREIVVTAAVPASRYVRAPLRSRLVQRIRVERIASPPDCGA